MKKSLSTFLLIFVFTIIAQTVYSQGFPYHLYNPRTLSELIEINTPKEEIDYKGSKQILISAKPFYSAVRVEYTGESRQISKDKLELFKFWQETLKINSDVLTRLDNEYLFKQCDVELWIPVQKQVASYFPKELEKKDKITLYLMAVGGIKPKDKWEHAFLVNEFTKYKE